MTTSALQLALLARRPAPEPFHLTESGWLVAFICACAALSALARCF